MMPPRIKRQKVKVHQRGVRLDFEPEVRHLKPPYKSVKCKTFKTQKMPQKLQMIKYTDIISYL